MNPKIVRLRTRTKNFVLIEKNELVCHESRVFRSYKLMLRNVLRDILSEFISSDLNATLCGAAEV